MIALKTETTNIRKVLKPIRYIRCASPCNILAGLKAKKTKQKLTPDTIPTMHDKRFTSALDHEIRMPRLRHSERLIVQDACAAATDDVFDPENWSRHLKSGRSLLCSFLRNGRVAMPT
jgi:hypothetical protein